MPFLALICAPESHGVMAWQRVLLRRNNTAVHHLPHHGHGNSSSGSSLGPGREQAPICWELHRAIGGRYKW